ncbi:MAG: LysM peptidoglycan-binding domain-containing protein [Deltaproteobacteria bacterium]|nr:LysM peptidoglycan-binding domain-containing protein [Deltaproteobacteria bacterium]
MIENISVKRLPGKFLLLALLLILFNPLHSVAQVRTHTVVKGDTLWGICEKYYGDPNLWPKLWEMNPFVTNPHLLKPGDKITLLEGVPLRVPKKKVEERAPEVGPSVVGLDFSGLINPETLGYLTLGEVSSFGNIFASKNDRIILSFGDTVYVLSDRDKTLQPGQEFFVVRPSPLIKHPVSKKPLGHIMSVRGRLRIEGPAGINYKDGQLSRNERTYSASIIESFNPIGLGDVIVPYSPVSTCVQPVPVGKEMVINIVAAKDNLMVLGQYSVVYIDRGFRHGIRRGNIFEIVQPHIVTNPEEPLKPWRERATALPPKSKLLLPDISLGAILVVESRPDTSTGIVLYANEIFSVGTYLKGGFEPVEDSKALSSLPTCTIQ